MRHASQKEWGEIYDFVLQKTENFPPKSIESVLSFGNFPKKEKNSLVLIGMPSRILSRLTA